MEQLKKYFFQICVSISLFIGLFVFWSARIDRNELNHIKIGVTYMTMNNNFYDVITEEIKKVSNQNNDQLYIRDPALNEEKQIEQINDFIDMKIDYLIINPVNSSTVLEALKKAKESGMKIIVVDVPLEDESIADCTIVSDNYNVGVQCAKHMMEEMKQADIVLLEHNSVISACDRIQGFLDTIEGNDNYRVIARKDCLGQTENALPRMREVIESGSDFQVVMCLNDPSAMGALAALEENGISGVHVYGCDGSPDMKKLIQNNDNADATAAQSPIEMGQKAIETVYQIEKGEEYEQTIVIPTTFIDKTNIDQYSISGWQ